MSCPISMTKAMGKTQWIHNYCPNQEHMLTSTINSFPFYYAYPFLLVFTVVNLISYDIWYVSIFWYCWQGKTDLVTSFHALHWHICWALACTRNSERWSWWQHLQDTVSGEPWENHLWSRGWCLPLPLSTPTAWLWEWPHALARSISSQDSSRKNEKWRDPNMCHSISTLSHPNLISFLFDCQLTDSITNTPFHIDH